MNIGDGLLFELENGKPRLILLRHGAEKNAAKPSFRPRAANILSSRQPSCMEEVQGEEHRPRQPAGRHQEVRHKARRAAASFSSNITTTEGRNTTLTSCKTNDDHKRGSSKVVAKGKSDRQKHSGTVGPLRVDGRTGPAQNVGTRGAGKAGLKEALTGLDAGLKENVVCLTSEQLQQILSTVQTSSNGQLLPDDHQGPGSQTQTSMTEGEGGEMKKEDGGREEEIQKGRGEAEIQEKDRRLSGCLFSWMEERESDSRVAIDARKARWKKELDEQVALKQQQQCSVPARLQVEEDADSVLSVQSCVSHRELPAAIRSSLRLGEVTPMEETLTVERKEEERRRWLEELDHQREETTERRRREKLLQSQTEDVAFWATHFDSLQRRPPVHPAAPSAPTPAQFSSSERGEWDPSSLWEAMSSCGAESVGTVSVDTVSGYPTRPSYLRTMTALLDPAQIEEKERRRLKQLEQQRAIQAQMEERRQQRERDQAKRRQEEEAEERRVMLEREMLQKQYEMDTLREKQKEQPVHQAEQPKRGHEDGGQQETLEPSAPQQAEGLKASAVAYKDSAVQTDAVLSLTADRAETPDVSAQYQLPPLPPPSPPPLPPPPPPTTPPSSKSRAVRTGKENICLPAGGDPYEAFARRDKKRPEWNTQRPSRRFVPASERYPVALQKNRQESRLKRQAELLALQERTCLSRTGPPLQNQESGPCPNPSQTRTSPSRKVENDSSGPSSSSAVNTERGRSPPVPAFRHRVQTPPPVLEFVPYVRTDEVFNMDPLEPADTPPPQAHTGAPPAAPHRDPLLHPELLRTSHTHRQQEILRGLAQLRQGLLQKQRELETDLNPLLKRHDNGRWSPSTTQRM
ncbi:coiled-coil domain-containing protein 66 isoform X2 [Acanthochromis polyacanthus]|uniref:coiled-coil domain-containing protein 66 isoform X2 n=1 Tax=Acanthochromis polyacanthus TaxID=80966 RepID=UPI0022346C12|nr:coiled-coil domain-containing protein 66 isoform X2 [Acanthochromis polyacanthus]